MTNKNLTKKSKKWLKLALISTASVATLATIPASICATNVKTSTPTVDNKLQAATYHRITFHLRPEDIKGEPLPTLTGKTVNKLKQGRPFGSVAKPTATWLNHTFVGWSLSKTKQSPDDTLTDASTISADTDVYAVFKDASSIVVRGKSVLSKGSVTTYTVAPGSQTEVDWYVNDGTSWTGEEPSSQKASIDKATGKLTANNITEENEAVYVFALSKGSSLPESKSIEPDKDKPNFLKIKIVDPSKDPAFATKGITELTDSEGHTHTCAIDLKQFSEVTSVGEFIKGIDVKDGTTEITSTTTKEDFTSDISIGDNITEIPDNFLSVDGDKGFKSFNGKINFPDNGILTHIGSNFLGGNTVYNQELALPSTLLSINDHFLSGCTAFNQEVIFTPHKTTPSKEYKIFHLGDYFMNGCSAFSQVLELPASVEEVGTHFMFNCVNQKQIKIDCPAFAFKESDGSFAVIDEEYTGITHDVEILTSEATYGATYADMKTLLPDLVPSEEEGTNMVRGLVPHLKWDDPTPNYAYIEDSEHVLYPMQASDFNSLFEENNPIKSGTKIWQRADFNEKIYLSPDNENLKTFPMDFLAKCPKFNQPIRLPNVTTKIGPLFLSKCSEFNQPINFPNGVTEIGSQFLSGCTSYNQPITLPENLTSIESEFLSGCTSYNQPITLPENLTSIASNFMYNCDAMTSIVNIKCSVDAFVIADQGTFASTNPNAPCYEQGIKIDGLSDEDWNKLHTNILPDRDESPFRKTTRTVQAPKFVGAPSDITVNTNSGHTKTTRFNVGSAPTNMHIEKDGEIWDVQPLIAGGMYGWELSFTLDDPSTTQFSTSGLGVSYHNKNVAFEFLSGAIINDSGKLDSQTTGTLTIQFVEKDEGNKQVVCSTDITVHFQVEEKPIFISVPSTVSVPTSADHGASQAFNIGSDSNWIHIEKEGDVLDLDTQPAAYKLGYELSFVGTGSTAFDPAKITLNFSPVWSAFPHSFYMSIADDAITSVDKALISPNTATLTVKLLTSDDSFVCSVNITLTFPSEQNI